ncbi:hypothetical protein [Bdellovibrio bacteriovorus]|uniref:hypothetical protein n=1 Tax=Bdellovibrio bacteriovorus TaxID=959 RepID=UPI0035A5EA37
MTKEYIEIVIRKAIEDIENETPRLPLEARIGERAVVGRLALHLTKYFSDPELSVDIEYNIDPVGDRKWLDAHEELSKAAKDVKRKVYEDGTIAVIPDVIIHKRGTNEKNLAVIEVKFSDVRAKESSYARLKLTAFTQQPFEYIFGVLVSVPRVWEEFSMKAKIEFVQ